MRDDNRPLPPCEPGEALRALPLLNPPRDVWAELRPRLGAQPATPLRPRTSPWLAVAATLALALGLARWLAPGAPAAPAVPAAMPATDTPSPDSAAELARLQGESAQLEAWIDWQQGDAVASGASASLGLAMQGRIAQIDLLLARADLAPEARLPLWQERVLRLRQLAGLDTTRQWLAARGDADTGVPVLAF